MRYRIDQDLLRIELDCGFSLVFEPHPGLANYRLTRVEHLGQLVTHGMHGPIEALDGVWAGGSHGGETGHNAYLCLEWGGLRADFNLGVQNPSEWRDADVLTLRTYSGLSGRVERRVEHRITPSAYWQTTIFETVRAHTVTARYADMIPLVRPEWTDWGAVPTSVSSPPHTSGTAEAGAEAEFRGPGRSVTVYSPSSVSWYWSASSADKYKVYLVADNDLPQRRWPGDMTQVTTGWVFRS